MELSQITKILLSVQLKRSNEIVFAAFSAAADASNLKKTQFTREGRGRS